MRTGTGRAVRDTILRPRQAASPPVHMLPIAQQTSGYTAALAYQRGDTSCTFPIEVIMNARIRHFAELRARPCRQGKELDMTA